MSAGAAVASARSSQRFRRVRLVVAGDLVADEFIYGQLDRVSREAPVLILQVRLDRDRARRRRQRREQRRRARRARRRRRASSAATMPATRLLGALPRARDVAASSARRGYVTPVKTRILAGGVHSAKQQVVRIDRAGGRGVAGRDRRRSKRALAAAIRGADVVILSDYGGGLVTPARLAARAGAHAAARRRRSCSSIRATRSPDSRGMTACTPNESGSRGAARRAHRRRPRACSSAPAARCSRGCGAAPCSITRGSRGMALFEPGRPTDHIPIVGSDQVADVTGAGDTVIATFTLALAAGRVVRRSGAPRQSRRRPRRHEARHGDGHAPTSSLRR